jgi:ABC-type multidrug transport system permease subunit
MFGVPIVGNFALLAALTTLFIATNLSFGYTFSTLAQNQLQAMQMSMMFFLPNLLLSGFIFPFLGMPRWAQVIGEFLPLTHYIAHRALDHAQGRNACRAAVRRLDARRPDGARHDHRGHELPPHARLSSRVQA